MNPIARGLIAGFGATVALSVLMILKNAVGLLPELNAIALLTNLSHALVDTPVSPMVGWVLHFLIGTVLWGVLFALLQSSAPGEAVMRRALAFGTGAWLLMMVFVMPLADKGFFALEAGFAATMATLVLHLIWGAVLGGIYQALPARAGRRAGGSHVRG